MEHIPFKPSSENQRAKEEHEAVIGHHSEDLFDQDEDAAGNLTNAATGEKFNNSLPTRADFKEFDVVEATGEGDILPPIPQEEDAAAKWLRENDPKYNA